VVLRALGKNGENEQGWRVSVLAGEMRQREGRKKSSSFVELDKKKNSQVKRKISDARSAYHRNRADPKRGDLCPT
jgi:hypothetical protein